ncbi:histidinol-phosphate transaminase [Cytobacillus gottheilii]|uniref:Histidinol-phosphate aminotransferase n=1 Tax=Cytobacillus gottheilii TaxID=859144 RepID=A0ABX8F758_9BACI|nr:histidinol-phosphate transaminase [Cytobacillus gottheilii]QVY60166.1 histidinol-phosphate transaminase [Cytobacillus gottheilii]
MKWKEQLLSLTPYQPGKSIEEVKKQYGLAEITKLASNENPFGCSQAASDAMQKDLSYYALYPDGYAQELRDTLSSFLKVKPSQLIFGNGSDEIILMIARALLSPGTNTITSAPTFPQYKHNAIVEGAEIREAPLKNGGFDLDKMLELIDENTSVVWICTPNNPTGVYIPEKDLIAFIEKVSEDVLVVIDEAYCEYTTAEDYHDSVKLVERFPNVIALRTFSKIYGLASLRIGYGIANEKIIRGLEPVREPFNANRFAQAAAIAAVGDQSFIENCKEANRKGLEQFYTFCKNRNLKYYPSQANFILIDFAADADEVFQYLLEKGYIVRSGKALGFPEAVRVTIGSEQQNEGVISAMEQYLKVQNARN